MPTDLTLVTALLSVCIMPSDVIDWVQWLGLGSHLTALLLLIYVLLLRGWLWLQDRNRQRAWDEWRPLCMNAICGLPYEHPSIPVTSRNWLFFFQLWHHYLLNMRGEARNNLQQLGLLMGLHHIEIKKLDSAANDHERIAAIITSGISHDIRAWNSLLRYLDNSDSTQSVAAAIALTRINPENALPKVIPLIGVRSDWNKSQIARLLLEVGPEQVSAPLLQAITQSPKDQTLVLLQFLRLADIDTCDTVLLQYLTTTQHPEILCACLKAVRSSKVLPLVRNLLTNENWFVRVEVANTLGYLGTFEDIDGLLRLLVDSQWWVRYRAAQAIGELLHRDSDKMLIIQQQQTDRYAADILMHVASEWKSA